MFVRETAMDLIEIYEFDYVITGSVTTETAETTHDIAFDLFLNRQLFGNLIMSSYNDSNNNQSSQRLILITEAINVQINNMSATYIVSQTFNTRAISDDIDSILLLYDTNKCNNNLLNEDNGTLHYTLIDEALLIDFNIIFDINFNGTINDKINVDRVTRKILNSVFNESIDNTNDASTMNFMSNNHDNRYKEGFIIENSTFKDNYDINDLLYMLGDPSNNNYKFSILLINNLILNNINCDSLIFGKGIDLDSYILYIFMNFGIYLQPPDTIEFINYDFYNYYECLAFSLDSNQRIWYPNVSII
jgi:hypothetical protein